MELFLHCTAEWGQNQDCTLHCPEFLKQMRRTRWKSEASRHISAYFGKNQQYAIKNSNLPFLTLMLLFSSRYLKCFFLYFSHKTLCFFWFLFNNNNTKVIRADLLDFTFALDFCLRTVSNLVIFQFWGHFSYDDIFVLVIF